MLLSEIRSTLRQRPDLLDLLPDTEAISAALSSGRTRVISRLGGVGTVLEVLGPEAGAAVLDALNAMRAQSDPIRWAWLLIERGELDFGSPSVRAMIAQLAQSGVIGAPDAASLLSISEVPDAVSEFEVRQAVWNHDGSRAV